METQLVSPPPPPPVLPVGGVQQRRLAHDRESDPQSAAEDPLPVLEDGQGADGHPDQRAPSHLGRGLQPPAGRCVRVCVCL